MAFQPSPSTPGQIKVAEAGSCYSLRLPTSWLIFFCPDEGAGGGR